MRCVTPRPPRDVTTGTDLTLSPVLIGDAWLGRPRRTGRTEEHMTRRYTPNDQRSIVKNPNNPARAADIANRTAQGHIPATPPAPPAQPPQQATQTGTQGGKK